MKIIEIIPNLQVGGAEKLVVDLSNEFARNGHDVYLVTLFDRNPEHVFESFLDSRIKRLELNKKSGFDLNCLRKVYKIIKEIRPDVVHAHVDAVKYIALSSLLYRKCKYVVTIHNDAAVDSGRGFNLYIRSFMYKCKLVVPVTISKASSDSFKKLFGLDTVTICNGCTSYDASHEKLEINYRNDVDFLFVHAASIQPSKNQLMLVQAFEELLKTGVKARLLFMGRPCDSAIFCELNKHWTDYIVYLGQIPNVRDYMYQADAFCLSSHIEGMPITIIEALSTGCVPLVTPAGGNVNMIHHAQDGFVSSAIDLPSYIKILKDFTSLSKDERLALKLAAVKNFDANYNITQTAISYLHVFAD